MWESTFLSLDPWCYFHSTSSRPNTSFIRFFLFFDSGGASKAPVEKKNCVFFLLLSVSTPDFVLQRWNNVSLKDPWCCRGSLRNYSSQNNFFLFGGGVVVILRVSICQKYTNVNVNVEWHISMHSRRGCMVAVPGIGGFPAVGPSHRVPHWFAFP